MSKYLVKLRPVDAFFFGGEKVFSFYKQGDKLENNLIKSREFPQQTSILGMIRKEVLVLNKLIKEKWDYSPEEKQEMKELIGERSFNIEGANDNFGIIRDISPVFIIKETESNDRFLIKIPKDHNKDTQLTQYMPFKFDKDKEILTNAFKKPLYLPSDFNAKIGLSEDFIDIKTGEIISQESVFKKDSCIGIKLNESHQTEENSLFRLEKYRFNYNEKIERNNKCFGFILDIDDKAKSFEHHKNVVSLGGEGSYFSISFEKVNFNIKDKIEFINKRDTSNEVYYKIILLSDTYISKEDYEENCAYSISKKIDFRNLKSEKYDENKEKAYYKRFEKTKFKYLFLEKGSVLFSDKEGYKKLIESISDKKFQKIGYNIFI